MEHEVRAAPPACASARRGLAYYRAKWREYRARMGGSFVHEPMMRPRNCADARWLAVHWRERARVARRQFEWWFRTTLEKWSCIHEHEGAWTANTGNGYYGGLQMTRSFQQTYGPEFYRRWGTADKWPIWAQLIAAERAWRESGFSHWGTASACGLR